jgi:NADH-quinone oxidoreductase subunit J
MVLFLFVVTMLAPDQDDEVKADHNMSWQRIVGSFLGLVLVAALSYLLFTGAQTTGAVATHANSLKQAVVTYQGDTQAFGMALFHGFLFPFEVTSLLIIVALLGALVFGRRAN